MQNICKHFGNQLWIRKTSKIHQMIGFLFTNIQIIWCIFVDKVIYNKYESGLKSPIFFFQRLFALNPLREVAENQPPIPTGQAGFRGGAKLIF